MRQIVLDTETTGLEPDLGHRIIEIGCVELVNRRATGRTFHKYINPEREIDEGALAVHGISRAELEGKPKFAEVVEELTELAVSVEVAVAEVDVVGGVAVGPDRADVDPQLELTVRHGPPRRAGCSRPRSRMPRVQPAPAQDPNARSPAPARRSR